MRKWISTLFLTLVSAFLALSVNAKPLSESQIKQLEKALASQLALNHIPGLSIAIVKEGEIALTRGFGVKDIDKKLPVTQDTLFPIGSVSKPITAILAGMRVDDGALRWDDLLADYLPFYTFSQHNETVPITLRDALSHRTGYARNDTLWANPEISRLDVLKAAPRAMPQADLRDEYHYNNVMFLAAGMVSAHDKGFDWDRLLDDRLLTPLNMLSTTTDYSKVADDQSASKGYYWLDLDNRYHPLPLRNLHNIAPAGGLYSNAEDMAQWLLFLLNQGRVQNRQLIAPNTLREIFTPTMTISPAYSYGLGWNVSEYKEETLIEHAGNIEGYSALVAMLPESEMGFILLMNVSISPLQASAANLIFDILTSPESEVEDATPKADYSRFAGDYLANFWQFQNVHFTFTLHGEKPALNIPGQTLYMLKPPDKTGKFYFELTDNVAVSFNVDEQGKVISMVHHEEGQQFVLPKQQSTESEEKDEAQPVAEGTNRALLKKLYRQQQRKAYEKLGRLVLTGTLFQQQSGVRGHFNLVLNKRTWHLTQNLGTFGRLETKVDPAGGMNKRLRHAYPLKGYLHEQAAREHPLNFLYWDEIYKKLSLQGDATEQGSFVVTLEGFDLSAASATVEVSSGQVQEITMPFIDPVWGTYPRTLAYSDYQVFCGLNIPRELVIDDHETGKTVLTVTGISGDNCTH